MSKSNWIFFLMVRFFRAPAGRGLRVAQILATLGVALGVTTLTLTQSVMSGFEHSFKESILGFNAHLVVQKQGEMKEPQRELDLLKENLGSEAVAMAPFLYRETLFVSKGKVKGAVLKGIDPLTFSRVYAVKVRPKAGAQPPANIEDLLHPSGKIPKVVLGSDLAEALGQPVPGQTLRVFLPKQGEKGNENFRLLEMAGIFSSGHFEFDSGIALVDLAELQDLFEVPNVVTGVEINLRHPDQADEIANDLEENLGPFYQAVSWQKLNGALFKALRLERVVFFIIMSLVVLVAVFNIIGVLLLLLLERRKEISILRVLGAPNRSLRRLFGWQGWWLGGLGSLLGAGLGMFLAWLLKSTGWLKVAEEVYKVHELPVDLSPSVMLAAVGASCLIAWLVTQLGVARLKKMPLDL